MFLDRRIVRIGAVGKKANITRPIDEDEPDDGYQRECGDGDTPGGRSPSGGLNDVRDQREEDELARRPGSTHHAEHQPAAFVEPTVDDQGAENERRGSDTESDDDAPQNHQMPWVGHHGGQAGADRDQSQRTRSDIAHTEAAHQGSSEGRGESVENQVDRDRDGGDGS